MDNTTILYQHGTLALLVPGLLTGTMTMKELLTHGDTGIGTGEGLDGELIILDGVAYQVNAKGQVNKVNDDFTVPFASVHFGQFKPLQSFSDLKMNQFENEIAKLIKAPNTFFAVLAKGSFKTMKTRAVAKSRPPYQTLVETAKAQSIFERGNVSGTLLSYYAPDIFHGVAVGGFHTHFLADDQSIGGHVLDYTIDEVDASSQIFSTLEQHLPIENKEFMEYDFNNDSIGAAIDEAEK